MSNSLNLSHVIECLRNLIDGIRCTICDKAEGNKVRYPCGHSTCAGCQYLSEGCTQCLTPPNIQNKSLPDEPFSQRALNSCRLLNICQETFKLDVYKKIRISEQLRIEKQVFPQCIQAPLKYNNKRKSYLKENKENLSPTIYPGEDISQPITHNMNRKSNYVQQWLNKNQKYSRKVLSDLNVNCNSNTKSLQINNCKDTTKNEITNNKRPHSSHSQSIEENKYLISKKSKTSNGQDLKESIKNIFKNENDESGIVIDDDEPILIEDSQSVFFDKDALALEAVAAADKNHLPSPITFTPAVLKSTVPFFKKGNLSNSCINCTKDVCDNITDMKDLKNVSITIENTSFLTTINISNFTKNYLPTKTVEVQTDINDLINSNPDGNEKEKQSQNFSIQIPDKELITYVRDSVTETFPEYMQDKLLPSPSIFELNKVASKKRCLVIDDSDSDVSSIEVSILHVSADVHRSSEPHDYGVLGELDANKLPNRSKNKTRDKTPDSNNSSEKENYDPNKKKIRKNIKKMKILKKH